MVFLVLSSAKAEETVGSIVHLRGLVHIYRAATQLAGTVGMLVLIGDKIETLADAEVTLVLHGGTELELSESSTMIIDQNVATEPSIRSTVRLLLGRLRALVNATAGARSVNFEIHTPNAVAGARGTNFEVAFVEGKPCPAQPTCLRYTTVGVYQGTVVVANPTSPPGSAPVTVTAGYQTTIPCETPPTAPSPWGTEELRAPGYH
jgi:ferric-dicitrate binding protein FerR (iron transport regulator)